MVRTFHVPEPTEPQRHVGSDLASTAVQFPNNRDGQNAMPNGVDSEMLDPPDLDPPSERNTSSTAPHSPPPNAANNSLPGTPKFRNKVPRGVKDGWHEDLTIKQEKFAYFVVSLGDKCAAYRQAYNPRPTTKAKSIERYASALTFHPGIAARIQLEKERQWGRVSRESLTVDLEEDRQLARKLGQIGPAIGATRTKAQLHGLIDSGRSDPATVLGALADLVSAIRPSDRTITRSDEPEPIPGELAESSTKSNT